MKLFAKLVLLLTLCASAFGATTVTPTLLTGVHATVEYASTLSQPMVLAGSDGFARELFFDTVGNVNSLVFIKCNDATCSSPTYNTVYTYDGTSHIATGCLLLTPFSGARMYYSMSLGPGDVPRIVFQGQNGLTGAACPGSGVNTFAGSGFIECADSACASSTFTSIAVFSGPDTISVGTNSSGVSSVLWGSDDGTNNKLKLTTCSGTSCAAATTIATVVDTTLIHASRVAIAADQTVRFAYYAGPNTSAGPIHYWNNGTDTSAFNATRQSFLDIALDSNGNAYIVYMQNNAGTVARLVHCTNATCSTNTSPTSLSVGSYVAGKAPSVIIGGDGFARVSVPSVVTGGPNPYNGLWLAKCNDADCTAPTVMNLQSSTGKSTWPYYTSIAKTDAGIAIMFNMTDDPSLGCGSGTCVIPAIAFYPETFANFTITATPSIQTILGL